MNNLSIERLKDFERDPLNNFLSRSEMMEVVKELIAIRELKGDQVPVGEVVRVLRGLQKVTDVVWKGGEVPEAGTQLFTAPQKLVVSLHPTCHFYGNEYLNKRATIAAIEAAGGVVKDGDADTDDKPKQPFKAGDLIVQRHCHGEDYFIVDYAHDNGGLDVTGRDNGIKYGLTAWRCELVSRKEGE